MTIAAVIRQFDPEPGTAPDGRHGTVDPDSGGLWVETDDGGMELLEKKEWNPRAIPGAKNHYDNLVDILDPAEVSRIGNEVWNGVTADQQSRREYMEMTAEAIRMLGLRLDPPRSDAGGSGAPLEGMSTVRHPLLLEACLGFQSDFRGEMLPADGPVKVRNDATSATVAPDVAKYVIDLLVQGGALRPEDADAVLAMTQQPQDAPPPVSDGDMLAEDFEKDFNHFLTVTATEYYPDTDRAAFVTGLMGCTFKKIYCCPLRQRPVSESVSAKDLIVDAGVTDLANAPRVTHEITMLSFEVRQMMEAGVYAEMPLQQGMYRPDPIDQAVAEVQGFDRSAERPEDRAHVIWECYTRANIRGLDDGRDADDDGDKFRIPLPYKVSIDRDSRQVFEIRRNWRPEDKKQAPRRLFVKYPFVPALGFYDIGLMHILGNTTMALTAGWRLQLDSLMFSNFPGFIYSDQLGKQLTNIFRVPPGGGVPIQTGGAPLNDMITKLPYAGPSVAGMQLLKDIGDTAARVGNKPNIPTGEGVQNAPVGTVLAQIIEATKLVGAVFKRLHAAQAEEFGLLKERFREDPEAFYRHNEKPARQWEVAEVMAALKDCDLVPAADPNTPSMMHRIMQRMAVFQVAQAAPTLFKLRETAEWVLRGIGVTAPDSLLKTEQQVQADQAAAAQAGAAGGKPTDPVVGQAAMLRAQAAMAGVQQKQALTQAQAAKAQAEAGTVGQEITLRAQEAVVESHDRAADRAAQLEIDRTREETARLRLSHEQNAQAATHVQDYQMHADTLAHDQQVHQDTLAQDQQVHADQHKVAVTQANKPTPKPASKK